MFRAYLALLAMVSFAAAAQPQTDFTIPQVTPTASKRLVTVDDLVSLRKVAALSVSPDGRRYAIYVRQADAQANDYRAALFVGSVKGGDLKYVGDGGQTRFLVMPNGATMGDLHQPELVWSPDEQWIAYTLKQNGEVQLWRSNVNSGVQQQVSRNPSDVVAFSWSENGRRLFFTVGSTREQLKTQAERRARSGYRYNEDLQTIFDLMNPVLRVPPETDLKVWVVGVDGSGEHEANAAEQAEYQAGRDKQTAGAMNMMSQFKDAVVAPVVSSRGAAVWLKQVQPRSIFSKLAASMTGEAKDQVVCEDERCTGMIMRVWWSEDGKRALFLRWESGKLPGSELHAWAPEANQVTTVARFQDDIMWRFAEGADGKLIAARETPNRPVHIVAIDELTGKIQELADVNPQFRNIRLGRIERIAWDAPKLAWNEPGGALAGAYPKRAEGYILYPPDFDPKKTYPVFIEPYAVTGFSSGPGNEHPLQAYAAAGMVVLSFGFPEAIDSLARLGPDMMLKIYSAELDFPHLTMLMESTVKGLDTVVARGFVDSKRVGIGGVSHGTFIPLYMMQKHDRITAISISAASWEPGQYYWPTRKGRAAQIITPWEPKPVGAGAEYWRKIDIAEHIDEIEAPIIMHHSLGESKIALRFMRHLDDEGRPYDAYVYTNEFHVKWQPAHVQSIMQRNYDWFRYWLQDYVDPAPEKKEQYQSWQVLREMQCKNPRSLRDYCAQTR